MRCVIYSLTTCTSINEEHHAAQASSQWQACEAPAADLLAEANGDKSRNFVETVESQIGLKDDDPQRDKRFSGTKCVPCLVYL